MLRLIAEHLGVEGVPDDIQSLDDGYLSDIVSLLVYDDARRRQLEETRRRNTDYKPMPGRRR